MSIDHQLSELVEFIIIVIQYSLFIDPKLVVVLTLLLWITMEERHPKWSGNQLRNDSNFSTQ